MTTDAGQPFPLMQRDQWWVIRGEGFPLVCNGGPESEVMTIWGLESPASLSPGGQPLFEVHASLSPNVNTAAAGDVLEAVAEAARAFWAHATPFDASSDLVRQAKGPHETEAPPRGLPPIKRLEDIPSPEIPYYVGWLNYWSAAAAQAIGFPDPERDGDLLSRARRTASGGWLVRLTDEPLELDTPAHLDALKRTYERFPRIGGRSSS
ncbi:MAG TPA: DUF5953 family protein [Myxococcaceae bacterium]|nr:DUF5953 family protein [Myxococcaceae bacterium]